VKNLRIGITVQGDTSQSLWVNGLGLNILFLLRLLKKSPNDYYVCLLTPQPIPENQPHPDHLKGTDIFYAGDKVEDLDMVILMGSELAHDILMRFKSKPDKRLIAYQCGNKYILQTEQILFKPNDKDWYTNETCYDEVWYVPQQHENNHGFYKTLHRTNAIPVPFLWHNECLIKTLLEVETQFKLGKYKKGFSYDPKKEKKVIGVLEPNINIIKFCLIPTMIAEECYRTDIGKEKIAKLMLCSSQKISKDKTFLSNLKSLDLYKDGKISSEGRYAIAFILSQHMDIVVSHQIMNPLNYLYMDVAYMGYPILHNAWMCKDLGYYYEKCDVQQGAEKLKWILENHDSHIEEYKQNTSKVLARYSIENPLLSKVYDILIKNLFLHGNNGKLVYDENTNIYKF
jgi:hypothetical protein